MGNAFDSRSGEARRLKSSKSPLKLGSVVGPGKVDLASRAGVSNSPLTRWLHCHIEHDVRQDFTDRATQGGLVCRYCRGQ